MLFYKAFAYPKPTHFHQIKAFNFLLLTIQVERSITIVISRTIAVNYPPIKTLKVAILLHGQNQSSFFWALEMLAYIPLF